MAFSSNAQAFRFVILRSEATWESPAAAYEFAAAFLLFNRIQRDCTPRALPRASRSGRHVGLRPPRNDTSGGSVVHQRPPAVEFPCAGRSLSAATPHTSAFPILTIACANRQCPMGRRGRRPPTTPDWQPCANFPFPISCFFFFPRIPIDKVGFLCYDASIKRSEVAAMFFAAERMLGSRAEELAGRAAMRGACRE